MRRTSLAVSSVLVVTAAACVLAARACGLDDWQQRALGGGFLTGVVVWFLLPLLALCLAGIGPTLAGLNAREPARWLELACMALGVMGPIGGMAFAVLAGRDPRQAPAGLVVAVAYLLCLPLMGRLLRSVQAPTADAHPHTGIWLFGVGLLTCAISPLLRPAGVTTVQVVELVVIVGLGEELFFRGALQSLLDDAWGTNWRVFGANLGWGWLVQAGLFGLAHPLLAGDPGLWAWGCWAAAGGLCFGWLRARSGTVLAPALVHAVTDVIGLVVVPLLAG